MRQLSFSRILAASALVVAFVATGGTSSWAQTLASGVFDQVLGVAFSSLPSGWSVAPPGQYTPGTLPLVTVTSGYDLRLAVTPVGTADTSHPASAALAEADKLELGAPVSVQRTPLSVAGIPGQMLRDMPGEPNVQLIVAHDGALYDIVAFGGTTLQPDQLQALSNMRFIPRVGSFPSADPSAPRGPVETRLLPATSFQSASPNVWASPNNIDGHIQMFVFWGQSVNATCGSYGGNLATTCGGNFYGQGDHQGINNPNYTNDYYAIDWPLLAGNSVFPQTPSPQVTHAGWTQGGFMGYGIWVVLDNGYGVASTYAHLQDVTVTAGTKARAGYNIGHSGCTGSGCSAPHLHVAWVQNPSYDQYGQEYGGTSEPQTPLHTHNSGHPVYNSLYSRELVHGW